jgi:hypothetical protein
MAPPASCEFLFTQLNNYTFCGERQGGRLKQRRAIADWKERNYFIGWRE